MTDIQIICGWQHESFRLTGGKEVVHGGEEITLNCCQNDFSAASLVLQSESRAFVTLENHAAFFPQNHLPVIRVEVDCPDLQEHFLFRAGMHLDDDRVYKADSLVEGGSELVEAWIPLQLFLNIEIPSYTLPGVYRGKVHIYVHKMFEDEKRIKTLSFSISVKNVCLPARAERKYHLVIWQHPANLARHYAVPLFSDEHFGILEEYTKSLSKLGNVAATVTVGDVPWAGQFCYRKDNPPSDLFEYNMVRITKEQNGNFRYDYSVLERYLKLCRKYDMVREIYLFGLIRNWEDQEAGFGNITSGYPDAVRLRYTDLVDDCGKYMRNPDDIMQYNESLFSWLKQEGWMENCLVSADEPEDMAVYNKALETLKAAAPELKTQLDISPSIINQHQELVFDSYTPVISDIALSEEEEKGMTEKAVRRCKGKTVWSTCCWPLVPNSFLRSPLLECRLHGTIAEWLKMDGFLRWAFTCWPVDPMVDAATMEWPYGDAFLVYPGKNGKVMPSLRYFALRRGAGDYELMQMTKEKCMDGQDLVNNSIHQLILEQDITRWNFYQSDEKQFCYKESVYEGIKERFMEAIQNDRK